MCMHTYLRCFPLLRCEVRTVHRSQVEQSGDAFAYANHYGIASYHLTLVAAVPPLTLELSPLEAFVAKLG